MADLPQMVLQFLLGVPSALTHHAQLLRRRRTGIAFLVAAVLPRSRSLFLAHNGIVPPEVRIGKIAFRASVSLPRVR